MNDKIIKFKAINKDGFETQIKPFPASRAIPQWFKDLPIYDKARWSPDGTGLSLENGMANFSPKRCTPMLDSFTSGYIIPLWSDITINWENGFPNINWRTKSKIFDFHGASAQQVATPTGYSKYAIKYLNTWVPITPKGYSIIVTSPFGHRDMPLQAIPAIIDSDKSLLDLSLPMWIKDGWEGVVEKGTPLAQIIPFKRENWKSEYEYFEDNEFLKIQDKTFGSTIIGHYVKNVWSKKTYK